MAAGKVHLHWLLIIHRYFESSFIDVLGQTVLRSIARSMKLKQRQIHASVHRDFNFLYNAIAKSLQGHRQEYENESEVN